VANPLLNERPDPVLEAATDVGARETDLVAPEKIPNFAVIMQSNLQ
jgi:hypothetical protein